MTIRIDGRGQFEKIRLRLTFPGPIGVVVLHKGDACVQGHAQLVRTVPKAHRPSSGFIRCYCTNNYRMEQVLNQIFTDTNLINLESLCVKLGQEVYRLEITTTELNNCTIDMSVTVAACAVAHLGVMIRYVPTVLSYQQLDGRLHLDCIQEENPQGQLLIVLDKSGSVLLSQQFGCVDVEELLGVMLQAHQHKDIGQKLEDCIQEDLRRRSEELKQLYREKITE